MNKATDELLNNLYFNPDLPSSFSSVRTLFSAAKKENPAIKLDEVKKWLSKQLTYTLHKPVPKTYRTRPVLVHSIDELWQMDLVDLSKLSKKNDGYKFILSVIDVLSKYAWLVPLKSKNGKELKIAMDTLFAKTKRRPQIIQTDKGKEFLNFHIQNLFRSYNINFFTTHSERKASVVERFNRTIKSLMFKVFTKNNNRRYIDDLTTIINRYNNSYHRSIKMKLLEISKENEPLVWINIYEGKLFPRKIDKDPLLIGDLVRISVERGPFRKGYLEGWSEEIFIVKYIVNGNPRVYKLEDQAKEEIKGTFYKEELQKVEEPDSYRIEKVIRRKRDREGNLLYFVKWSGYPDKFNSFVTEEDLQK